MWPDRVRGVEPTISALFDRNGAVRFRAATRRSFRGRPPLVPALAACTLAALLGVVVAAQQASPPPVNLTRGCIERFDPTRDYFPDKITVDAASKFTVTYHRSYKVARVAEAYPGGPPETYVLVQCGAPRPSLTGALAGAQVVTVPVTSLFSASTTHAALLVDLKRLDVLAGVSSLADLAGDDVLAHVKTARVREFAPNVVIDTELVVASRPGVLMTGGSSSPTLGVVRSAGIPVVANIEWLESTALARAEWLKYMALFLNEERVAQHAFEAVRARYRDLTARALAVPEASRPRVMTGRSARGTFTVAGGRSYVAALIRDAGGRYVWADNDATGSVDVDFEAQLVRAARADVWINGGGWRNRVEMLQHEPRYAEFKAFRDGQVWVYERLDRLDTANDYWSRSVSHPDLLLADLVKIFLPSVVPSHAFEWYVQVPAR